MGLDFSGFLRLLNKQTYFFVSKAHKLSTLKAMNAPKPINMMTPILIAGGQYMQPLSEDLSKCLSPADIAGRAAQAALNALGDTLESGNALENDAVSNDRVSVEGLAAHIDLIASVRTFSDSSPAYSSPFGRSETFPLSVANRIGARPKHLIYDVIGGQSPQKLVTECCELLKRGDFEMALIVGGEALGNMKAAQKRDVMLDWAEAPELPEGCVFEDRGFGDVTKMVSPAEVNHGLFDPMLYYAFMETARRAALGLASEPYLQNMAALFAPFSQVAETNPFAMFPERFTESELARKSPRNRQLTTPYLKHFVAKDGVNQGAAVLLTTLGKAQALGVPRDKWVFLHGAMDTEEKLLLERESLHKSAALDAALTEALRAANLEAKNIQHFDLYSCFPVVVFNACQTLGLKPDDPRPLTQTGGLPFFGGPGNNYSLHAIVSMVETLQNHTQDYGLIHGNGGWMSKHSVGIYSNQAPQDDKASVNAQSVQEALNISKPHPHTVKAEGRGIIESHIVIHARSVPVGALIIGKLVATGERFYARAALNSERVLKALMADNVVGKLVQVSATPQGNVFELVESVFE